MGDNFRSSVEDTHGFSYLRLSGVIDEDNKLAELSNQIKHDLVVIHLAGIERINSCGVRDWVNWLTGLQKQRKEIFLVECSPAIVAQLNLVNNFTGGSGVVQSFYAPYFCASCSKERTRLLSTDDVAAMDPPKAPPFRCDECDGPMDFDDLEDSYFAFVKHVERRPLPPQVQAALAQQGPRVERKMDLLQNPGKQPAASKPTTPASVTPKPTPVQVAASTSFVAPTITPADVQGPTAKRSNALVVVLVLAVLAAAAIAWYLYTNRKPGSAATSEATTPAAPTAPGTTARAARSILPHLPRV